MLLENKSLRQPSETQEPKTTLETTIQKEIERLRLEKDKASKLAEGTAKTIKSVDLEINSVSSGIWGPLTWLAAKGSGTLATMEQQKKAEQNLLTSQRQGILELDNAVNELEAIRKEVTKNGFSKDISKRLEELLTRKAIISTDQYKKELEVVRSNYSIATERLDTAEVVLRNTRTAAVLTGVTLATGGAATTAMIAAEGALTVGGVATAVGSGVALGITSSAVGNLTEAVGHIDQGNKSAGNALKDAGVQTLRDAKSSLVASVGTVTGIGISGKVLSSLGETALGYTLSGVSSGVANGAISTSVNLGETAINYVQANKEFYQLAGDQLNGLSEQQISVLRTEFLESKGLSANRIFRDSLIDFGVIAISGGIGSRAGALQQNVKSAIGALAIGGAEITSDLVLGLGSETVKAKLDNRAITFKEVASQVVNSFTGRMVGRVVQRVADVRQKFKSAENLSSKISQSAITEPKGNFEKKSIVVAGKEGQIKVLAPTESRPGVAYVDPDLIPLMATEAHKAVGVQSESAHHRGAHTDAFYYQGGNKFLDQLGLKPNTIVVPNEVNKQTGSLIAHEWAHATKESSEFGAVKAEDQYADRVGLRPARTDSQIMDAIEKAANEGLYDARQLLAAREEFEGKISSSENLVLPSLAQDKLNLPQIEPDPGIQASVGSVSLRSHDVFVSSARMRLVEMGINPNTLEDSLSKEQIRFVSISSEELQGLWKDRKIIFKEKVIYQSVLDQISFPLNPEMLGKSPIFAIAYNKELLIMNGNHRLYKTIHHSPNPTKLSLVLFQDPRVFEDLFDLQVIIFEENTPRPHVTTGQRPANR